VNGVAVLDRHFEDQISGKESEVVDLEDDLRGVVEEEDRVEDLLYMQQVPSVFFIPNFLFHSVTPQKLNLVT